MMKKLLFLAAFGSLAIGASAQQADRGIMFSPTQSVSVGTPEVYKTANVLDINHLLKINKAEASGRAASKGTAQGGKKWYDPFAMASLANNGIFNTNANTFVWLTWFDSTVTQYYSASGSTPAGYRRVNWCSLGEYFDPISSMLFNDVNNFGGDIQVKNYNSYVVDSVNIAGAYVRMPTRPAGIVDTLIISVAPQNTGYYYIAKSNATYGSKISAYTTKDTAKFCAPLEVDSVGRSIYPASTLPGGTPRAYWKVPLYDTMGAAPLPTGSFTTGNFTFAVPNGGLTIPAGARFAVTVTFKSGDTWTKNVDSINSFHRFMPISGHINNAEMPYFRDTYNDLSNSLLMFSFDTSGYIPTNMIEIWNQPNMNYEFHALSAHVVCATCDAVGINDIPSSIVSTKAYPNPSNNKLNVSFNLLKKSDVTVTLTSALGQVIATETFNNSDNGEAAFNVANIPSGVYMYTVQAEGNTKTGRVAVAH